MITIKNKEEIEVMSEGGSILAEILDDLESLVKVGNTTLDIDDRAMELIDHYKVEPMILGYHPVFANHPYPAATCVSINDQVVHGIPNHKPYTFKNGDLVSIDLVIAYKGLVVDSARSLVAGEATSEALALIGATKEALMAGIKAARPGNRVKDITMAISGSVPKRFGIVEAFCGHGVGFDLHEAPQVPNVLIGDPGPVLKPGMVLAIEPMLTMGGHEVEVKNDGYTVVTKDGSLSAHVEHTVAIMKNGPEILTKRSKVR